MDTALAMAARVERPAFLGEMVETAERLGRVLNTYMRIDFFGTAAGAVFNEFSSSPAIFGPRFTPVCRDLFGAIWSSS